MKKLDKFGRALPTKHYLTPSITVDAIVLNSLKNSILVIKRKFDPFKGFWALPGGFLDYNEEPLTACLRELKEETGLLGREGNIGIKDSFNVIFHNKSLN